VLDLYNRTGQRVGRANYTLKEIRKIEIQTMEIMQLDPLPETQKEAASEKELTNELDKSFLKSTPIRQESLINELMKSDN
jgi:hypothetical protein